MNTELRMMLGLALLQAGRIDESISELENARALVPDPDQGPGAAIRTALALASAAFGDSARARELADEGAGKGTYLDQQGCRLAGAFARLQAGDEDAVQAFDEAVTLVDATEARLDQAIVRLARARAWTALGHPDRERAESEAQTALAVLGHDLSGWDRVFRTAAGASASAPSR
jgi:multidrug resistance efflux pump